MMIKEKKKPSKHTHSGLAKKHAWSWFSKYIRLKYSDDKGYCKCITCDKIAFWDGEGIQAGHGIPKGKSNSILFLEEVVRPQCSYCNHALCGRPTKYIPILIDLYGQDGVDEFEAMKETPKNYKLKDFVKMEEEFKELALGLADKKGLNINGKKK
jgi:hypothetical protein